MSKLSIALRRRSRELGLTNAEVARMSGLNERRYGNYATGRREPDLRTLVTLAAVLETTPDALLGLNDESIDEVHPGVGKVVVLLKQMSAEDVDLLVLQAEAIVRWRARMKVVEERGARSQA